MSEHAEDGNPIERVALDDLIALSDEMAALVRSGVPLEFGLGALSRDMPGRLGRLAAALTERLKQGEPLEKVLADRSAGFPPLYRAVIEAGVKSGRLAVALEGLARSARQISETRRMLGTAILYPLLVLAVAWSLFAFFTARIAPGMESLLDQFGMAGERIVSLLVWLGESAVYWGPVLPLLLLVWATAWLVGLGRIGVIGAVWPTRLIGCLPWAGAMLSQMQIATFADVLALLIENDVPLDEGLPLAGRASGGPKLQAAAERMAACIRQGDSLGTSIAGTHIPPMLQWLMIAGQNRGNLLSALRHASSTYRRRALHQADLARMFLPLILTVLIGGGAVFVLALSLFYPYVSMLYQLALP